jgi:hypothetical protein
MYAADIKIKPEGYVGNPDNFTKQIVVMANMPANFHHSDDVVGKHAYAQTLQDCALDFRFMMEYFRVKAQCLSETRYVPITGIVEPEDLVREILSNDEIIKLIPAFGKLRDLLAQAQAALPAPSTELEALTK